MARSSPQKLAYMKAYHLTEAGQVSAAKYAASEKGRAAKARSRKYPASLAAAERHRTTSKGRQTHNRATGRWKKVHRLAHNAHARVRTAIRRGRLVPQPCHCGATEVQAHHPHGYDGAAVFDVVWRCAHHHREEHHASV